MMFSCAATLGAAGAAAAVPVKSMRRAAYSPFLSSFMENLLLQSGIHLYAMVDEGVP